MSKSIQDIYHIIKSFLEDDLYFYTILIIVVGILSFGLGRMSVEINQNQHNQQIVLIENSSNVGLSDAGTISDTSNTRDKQFVASSRGTRYHHITCSSSKQIIQANRIYFNSIQEAQAAGFTPAKNCKF